MFRTAGKYSRSTLQLNMTFVISILLLMKSHVCSVNFYSLEKFYDDYSARLCNMYYFPSPQPPRVLPSTHKSIQSNTTKVYPEDRVLTRYQRLVHWTDWLDGAKVKMVPHFTHTSQKSHTVLVIEDAVWSLSNKVILHRKWLCLETLDPSNCKWYPKGNIGATTQLQR